MRTILVMMDSFKGSLTAEDACTAAAEGLSQAGISCSVLPLSDGGEGLLSVLAKHLGGFERQKTMVPDPLGRMINAFYLRGGDTAMIEMATSSGLTLLKESERDPLHATTLGFGHLIHHALTRGARKLLLGIGGSATNDLGAGMLTSLGFCLLDSAGRKIPPGAQGLRRLERIDFGNVHPKLGQINITVLSDVKNPLLGPAGATNVFALQKGLPVEALDEVEQIIAHAAAIFQRDLLLWYAHHGHQENEFRIDPMAIGAGAAGGVGFALQCLGATIRPGIEYLLDVLNARDLIAKHDLVVTGEGMTDRSSAGGKVVAGVAVLCRQMNVPCIVLSGALGEGYEDLRAFGATAFFAALPRSLPWSFIQENARALLRSAGHEVGQFVSALTSLH